MLFPVQSFRVKDLPEETAHLSEKAKGHPPVEIQVQFKLKTRLVRYLNLLTNLTKVNSQDCLPFTIFGVIYYFFFCHVPI